MKKHVCSICGYLYDDSAGDPKGGFAPGTKWEDLPETWVCPLCGAEKSEFKEANSNVLSEMKKQFIKISDEEQLRELSFAEMSALCSNLSKGCEKQYLTEESELFSRLADYYKSQVNPVDDTRMDYLFELIQQDLNAGYPEANVVATAMKDRGALRALVWGEKVTRMLSSLITKYKKEQGSFLDHTNVFVCEICGFVYVGDEAPEICPVCKVPRFKIAKVERG